MEKIILYADLHIHHHQSDWRRVDDAIEVLEWIRQEAINRDIKKVWFLGDFFHVRGYMYPTVVNRSLQALQKFKDSGIELNLLTGNHDMPGRYTTKHSSINVFGSMATIIDQPMMETIENYSFYWLPYIERLDQCRWALNKIAESKDQNTKAILLGHLDIHGAYYHTHVPSTHGITVDEIKNTFDMIITGHYHTRQTIGNITYIGSPYQQNFGEANEKKGFMIFDNGNLEFVENTFSPVYLSIKSSEINESIRNNYVTITVEDSNSLVEVRDAASKYLPRNITIKVDRTSIEEDRNIVALDSDTKDVNSMLKEWVKKTANPVIYDVDKLLHVGMSLVKDKDEIR